MKFSPEAKVSYLKVPGLLFRAFLFQVAHRLHGFSQIRRGLCESLRVLFVLISGH
jgi:hypothetical protein